ncbi:hypothetical protein ACFX13_033243 [Malus domestica]
MDNHSLVLCGFHFKPTDQELIHHFLRDFLTNRQLLLLQPYNTIIQECNLFGNRSEPSEIWEAYEGGAQLTDQSLYFFSELKKLNPMGSHIDRKIGSGGTWNIGKAVATWVNGTDGSPSPIGLKRTFCYKNEGSEDNGRWLLDEYSLFASHRKNYRDSRYDFDYVLCRLRKKDGSLNKRKCSTSEDQATSSKKKKCDDEKILKDDDHDGSKQIMNAINAVEEEGPQGTSCLTNDLVAFDHDQINEFTVGYDVAAYVYDIDAKVNEKMTINVAKLEELEELEELLGQEFQEAPLPTASGVVVANGEQALNSSTLEELIKETQEMPLAAACRIA